MFLFRENLCAKMIDARKQSGIPKSELAGSTSCKPLWSRGCCSGATGGRSQTRPPRELRALLERVFLGEGLCLYARFQQIYR